MAEEQAAIAPKIEHFAIQGSGLESFLGRLKAKGIPYEIAESRTSPSSKVNIFDPDRNHIHIDFPADEAEALDKR